MQEKREKFHCKVATIKKNKEKNKVPRDKIAKAGCRITTKAKKRIKKVILQNKKKEANSAPQPALLPSLVAYWLKAE